MDHLRISFCEFKRIKQLIFSLKLSENCMNRKYLIPLNLLYIRKAIQRRSLRKKCPYSELFWSVFSRIWTEYEASLRIQCECGKIRTRITPNTDTFHAVDLLRIDSVTANLIREFSNVPILFFVYIVLLLLYNQQITHDFSKSLVLFFLF